MEVNTEANESTAVEAFVTERQLQQSCEVSIRCAGQGDQFKILSLLEQSGQLHYVPKFCRSNGFENYFLIAEVEGVPCGCVNVIFNPLPFVAFLVELPAFRSFHVIENLMLTVFHLLNYSPFVLIEFSAAELDPRATLFNPQFYKPSSTVQ